MPKSPNFPTAPVRAADGLSGPILQDYVYASGIHDIEHSNILSYKYPQYFLTAMLERIGRYEAMAEDTFSWNEMDRTRMSAEVTAEGADGAIIKTVTTDVPYTDSGQSGYYLVGDVVRFSNAINAIIVAIGNSGSNQTLNLRKLNGTAWGAGDVAVGDKMGHVYNLFGEYSDAPKGRLFLPQERSCRTSILRRSVTVSGSELTNKTRIGDGKSWYYTMEDITAKELALDREVLILTGQDTASGLPSGGDGILQLVETAGTNTLFTGAVNEGKLKEHIKKMVLESDSTEMVAMCGVDFISDATTAMRDYHIGGGVNYGSFGSANTFGLELQSYKFLGKTIHFTHYQLFDDKTIFPYSGVPSNTIRNYSNSALFLDMGKDSRGKDLVTLKYKELDGVQRKLVHGYEIGMVGPKRAGGNVSNGKDGFSSHWLSEISLELRLLKRHGFMRANA